MSQKENLPENDQIQVNSEITEQELKAEQSNTVEQTETATTDATEAVNKEASSVSASQQLQEQAGQATQVKSNATGWKIATGVLAAAVIGLGIYSFVPNNSSNALVATINGEKITQANLLDKLVDYNYDYVAQLVSTIVDEKVVEQELAAKNLSVTDADLDAEIAAFRLKYPDENDFLSLLSYYGMTEDDLKKTLKQSSQIRLLLSDSITISDEQIQEYFDANVDNLGAHGERVRASHILVTDEDLAKDIITQLDEGADFASLAAQHGTDGTSQVGGDLGYFEFEEMIPEFSTAAFDLAVNTYSKTPVATTHGFHVILKTEEQAAYTPSLDELKDSIKIELMNSEIYTQHPTYIDDLIAKGKIDNAFETIYPNKSATVTP